VAVLRLKELRNLMNLTQADVAAQLLISRETYSRYETGEREMTYDALINLAELFSVSVDYILGRQENSFMALSDSEIPMIYRFRELDERGQHTVRALIAFEHSLND